MDFGIAKTMALKRITFGGFSPTMGTPDYMAPEQIKGKRGDERTDIYSLGAILFEMVTGQVPFQGPNAFAVMNARLSGDPPAPRELNSELSPQVEEVILHALEREPEDRYSSALAMKADLDDPKKVRLSGRSERLVAPTPWKSRFRFFRLAAISIAVPVVAFLLFWWMFSHRGGN
jgi:serine/threonine-protein kinase